MPFYFDPTLGGADIDGNTALASYQDYRFRAPNLLLLQGTFEHSIYGPLSFAFEVDAGKVALTRGAVDFADLDHSYSAGLTAVAKGKGGRKPDRPSARGSARAQSHFAQKPRLGSTPQVLTPGSTGAPAVSFDCSRFFAPARRALPPA